MISDQWCNSPSELKPYVKHEAQENEIGCILRIQDIGHINTLDQTCKITVRMLTYRTIYDTDLLKDLEPLCLDNKKTKILYPKSKKNAGLDVNSLDPDVRLLDVSDQKETLKVIRGSWKPDCAGKCCLAFEKEILCTLHDPTTIATFPFDWQTYRLKAAIQPTKDIPKPVLLGAVSKKMKSNPIEYCKREPYWIAYLKDKNKTQGEDKLLRHCAVCYDKEIIPQWDVYCYKIKEEKYTIPVEDQTFPTFMPATKVTEESSWWARVTIKFHARRTSAFFVSVLGMLTLMEMSCIFTFALDYDVGQDAANRQSINTTLLLAVLALRFSFEADVPKSSSLSWYDWRYLMTLFFIFLVQLFQTIVILPNNKEAFESDLDQEDLKSLDGIFAYITIAIFVLMNCIYWTLALYVRRKHPAKDLIKCSTR